VYSPPPTPPPTRYIGEDAVLDVQAYKNRNQDAGRKTQVNRSPPPKP
jgi:hypothetical protein